MKKRASQKQFLKELFTLVGRMKGRANQDHIISINANYGHYEILVHAGPGKKREAEAGHRPLEIKGEVHHMFVSPGHIRANPSDQQIKGNLRNTVIARGVLVHLEDPVGDGEHLDRHGDGNGMDAKEFINLAGNQGEKLIWETRHDARLSLEAYHIIQQDILKALKHHKKQALEYVS